MTSSFPLEARVILQDLVKAPELNGKTGIVKTGVCNGRQHVFVTDLNKSVALKISNLRYEGRAVESLSTKELKTILKAKNVSESEITGIDKSELQSKVHNLGLDGEKLAEILAIDNVKAPTSSVNPAQAANALGNMSPQQLRQQARAMKSMDPNTLRRMNPQLASMSDEQIKAAALQFEMMADNPEMMKATMEQVKNMQPGDIERMQREMNKGTIDYNESQFEQASNMMANMTPQQLRQQAEMMRSMDPNTLRRMNPQLASMSDEQIKAAASQFEIMADNPTMMKMAMDQMKHMTPEQISAIQNGTIPSNGIDPASMDGMLENMNAKQLKQMLTQVKTNPEMMKSFAKMSGLNEEQMSKGIDQFANMDEASLDKAVTMMKKAQKLKNVWSGVNEKVGGHFIKIVFGIFVIIVCLVVRKIWFSSGYDVPFADVLEEIPNVESVDEFESEF